METKSKASLPREWEDCQAFNTWLGNQPTMQFGADLAWRAALKWEREKIFKMFSDVIDGLPDNTPATMYSNALAESVRNLADRVRGQ